MNIYNDCPLDSRDFTDYRSSSDINNELISKFNLKNTNEFNDFIRNKGNKYFIDRRIELEKLYGCGPYNNNMLNEKYIQNCNKNGCNISEVNKNGLGTGRNMNISDMNIINNNIIKGGNTEENLEFFKDITSILAANPDDGSMNEIAFNEKYGNDLGSKILSLKNFFQVKRTYNNILLDSLADKLDENDKNNSKFEELLDALKNIHNVTVKNNILYNLGIYLDIPNDVMLKLEINSPPVNEDSSEEEGRPKWEIPKEKYASIENDIKDHANYLARLSNEEKNKMYVKIVEASLKYNDVLKHVYSLADFLRMMEPTIRNKILDGLKELVDSTIDVEVQELDSVSVM